MKVAVEVGSVADGTIKGCVEYCKALEVDRVVLTATQVPGFRETGLLELAELKAQKAMVEDAGMTTSTVVYWAPPALGEGGPEAEKLFDALARNLGAMAEAGLSILSMFAGVRRPVDPADEDGAWEKLTGFYRRLTAQAEQSGVKVASHFAGTAPAHSILNGASAYRRLFDAVPSAANGLCFCVGNAWVSDGDRIFNVIRELGPRILYVHTRSTKLYWGESPFWWDNKEGPDMRRVFQTLAEVGYQGDLRAEHMPEVPGENRTDIGTGWAIGYMKALLRYM
jgi:D-mannonate dehydratase